MQPSCPWCDLGKPSVHYLTKCFVRYLVSGYCGAKYNYAIIRFVKCNFMIFFSAS